MPNENQHAAEVLPESHCHLLGVIAGPPALLRTGEIERVVFGLDCGQDRVVQVEAPFCRFALPDDDEVRLGPGAPLVDLPDGAPLEVRGRLQLRPLCVVPVWTRRLPAPPETPRVQLETGPLRMEAYARPDRGQREGASLRTATGTVVRAVLPNNTWVVTGATVDLAVLPPRRGREQAALYVARLTPLG